MAHSDDDEFHSFAADSDIAVKTSSPEFPQANGQSERTIQTIKNLLRKAHEDYRGPYTALLQYRKTPVSGLSYSPAPLLMSRRVRDKLPTINNTVQQKIVQPQQQLEARQARQKYYFDRHTKEMPKLNMGDHVNIRRGKVWEKATVTATPAGELPCS